MLKKCYSTISPYSHILSGIIFLEGIIMGKKDGENKGRALK